MFGQIPPTQFDLRFRLLGIPVRVHPVFWLTSAFLAWEPGRLDMVAVRMLCIFVAIMVHEMGHALVTRSFGWDPEIVLYILGGYATTTRHSTWRDIAVSAAGPAAGFALFISVWFWCRMIGIIDSDTSLIRPMFIGEAMRDWPEFLRVGSRGNQLLLSGIRFTLWISLMWNVMNLLPVIPLDGGQIARELFKWISPRRGWDACLILSMITAGAVVLLAVWAKRNGEGLLGLEPTFLGLMFAFLGIQCFQQFQSDRRGYW